MNLSPNFKLAEFASKCGQPTPDAAVTQLRELAKNLEVLRAELKAAISVTSGYRSPEHNEKIGGEPNSFHMRGMAADIQVKGFTPDQVRAAIERLIASGRMKQGGLGLYATWVHYDIRGTAARWAK